MRSVQREMCVLTAAEISEVCQPSSAIQLQPLRQGYVAGLEVFECDADSRLGLHCCACRCSW